MRRIYIDHAAATPVDSGAARAVDMVAKKYYGNPSALHREGKEARAALEAARAKIAGVLSAHTDEIVFTSNATEANNLALQGIVRAAHARGIVRPHIIISAIEHPAILETARMLAHEYARVEILPVDARGLTSPRELRKRITPDTVLVSVMYANNEIGTIQPIREIAKEVRHARKMYKSVYPYFHTDAAQAANYLDLNVLRLSVDLITLSSSKTYGPRGIAALFIKRGINLVPLMYGGEHERGRRPGTEAVALAVGFAEALVFAEKIKAKEFVRVKKLRDTLAQKILKKFSSVSVNGDPEHSLPNILSLLFEGVDSEALIIYLDAAGIAVSGGSACKSGAGERSHVIQAIGKEDQGVIRLSLGRGTRSEDITRVVTELSRIIPLLRTTKKQSDL